MIRDILSIRKGECRYCITDDTPFFFCGDRTAPGSKYCAPHHKICHSGFGREIVALEAMINGMDGNIVRTKSARPNTVPVDEAIRGER